MLTIVKTMPVKIEFPWPDQATGKKKTQCFTAKFTRLSVPDLSSKMSGLQVAEGQEGTALAKISEFVSDVLEDWDGVEIPNMTRDEVKDFLVNDVTISQAMFRAYTEEMMGVSSKN